MLESFVEDLREAGLDQYKKYNNQQQGRIDTENENWSTIKVGKLTLYNRYKIEMNPLKPAKFKIPDIPKSNCSIKGSGK